MQKKALKILFEMIPVILGVLIALFINQCKDQVDDKRFLKRVLAAIEAEMHENMEELTTIIAKQDAAIDTIEVYQDDQTVSVFDILDKTNGLQIPTIKNTSWQSFLNSKIELVDYQTISILTEIEEAKYFMNLKATKLMDDLYNDFDGDYNKAKRIFRLQILNLRDSENNLIRLHRKYLEQEGSQD